MWYSSVKSVIFAGNSSIQTSEPSTCLGAPRLFLGIDIPPPVLQIHLDMLGPRRKETSEEDMKTRGDNISAGLKKHFANRSEEVAKKHSDNISAGLEKLSKEDKKNHRDNISAGLKKHFANRSKEDKKKRKDGH